MPGHYDYKEEDHIGLLTVSMMIGCFFLVGPFALLLVCCPCDTKQTKKWVEDAYVPPVMASQNNPSYPTRQQMNRDADLTSQRLAREAKAREDKEAARRAEENAQRDAKNSAQRQAARVSFVATIMMWSAWHVPRKIDLASSLWRHVV